MEILTCQNPGAVGQILGRWGEKPEEMSMLPQTSGDWDSFALAQGVVLHNVSRFVSPPHARQLHRMGVSTASPGASGHGAGSLGMVPVPSWTRSADKLLTNAVP